MRFLLTGRRASGGMMLEWGFYEELVAPAPPGTRRCSSSQSPHQPAQLPHLRSIETPRPRGGAAPRLPRGASFDLSVGHRPIATAAHSRDRASRSEGDRGAAGSDRLYGAVRGHGAQGRRAGTTVCRGAKQRLRPGPQLRACGCASSRNSSISWMNCIRFFSTITMCVPSPSCTHRLYGACFSSAKYAAAI